MIREEKRKVAFLSILAAVFLTSFKLVVGVLTGSLGILSEALHSALDLVAALITYLSVRISDRPADKEHHYGHGKVENFSALIETFLLLITCSWIIYEAIGRLVSGRTHIDVTIWSYVVVLTSMIVDFSRSKALYRVAIKHKSQALEADALHFSTDIWSSAVVLAGLITSNLGFFFADSIAAIGVAFIVLFISYRLGKRAVDVLLDRAPSGIGSKVLQVLSLFPEIRKVHSLKIRTSGADTFIKFNIHLDPEMNIHDSHEICDRIEHALQNRIPRSEIYIHVEPQDNSHCPELDDTF